MTLSIGTAGGDTVTVASMPQAVTAFFVNSANNLQVNAGQVITAGPYTGGLNGIIETYSYFQVEAFSTTGGQLVVRNGYDTAAAPRINQAVAANTWVNVKMPAFGSGFTVTLTQGNQAGNVSLTSGFTTA